MIGPHILHFEPGESLLDVNSVAIVAGYSWGRIYVPITPLDFSAERMRTSNFSEIMARERLSNEQFYTRCFAGSDLTTQSHFYTNRIIRQSTVDGVVLGLGMPDDAIFTFIKDVLVENLIGNLPAIFQNLDFLSYSTSTTNPLLWGLNGHNTFNLNSTLFNNSPRLNFCVINGNFGFFAEMSLSILLVGLFDDMANSSTMFHYLWNVYNNAFAFALVPTAGISAFTLEGADIKLIFT